MHTDAVQSVGKIPVDVRALGVDLLSLSAHKFNGPKGAGVLWVKRGTRMQPILTGGKHERSRRAGTENVPAIAGMGVAARLAVGKIATEGGPRRRPARSARSRHPRRASLAPRSTARRRSACPNTTNISFDRVEAESLLIALDLEGIAVSTGSACSSGTLEPSHVLRAMGFPAHRTQNSLRFSLGPVFDGGRGRSRRRGAAAAGGEAPRPDAESWLAAPVSHEEHEAHEDEAVLCTSWPS